jgi:hypothetical protein
MPIRYFRVSKGARKEPNFLIIVTNRFWNVIHAHPSKLEVFDSRPLLTAH